MGKMKQRVGKWEQGLEPLLAEIDMLRPDPSNARRHDKRNLEAICRSLERFGQQKPIVVRNGMAVAGSGLLMAAKLLGWTHVAVVPTELVGDELNAYAIADNRTGDLSEFDAEVLEKALLQMGPDLRETAGFTSEEFEALAAAAAGALGEEAEESPGPVYSERFEIVVECSGEAEQKTLYAEMTGRGLRCRILTL